MTEELLPPPPEDPLPGVELLDVEFEFDPDDEPPKKYTLCHYYLFNN
jgi:hypothetical protein